MNLFANPFYLLDASTQHNRLKISALANEKLMTLDADAVTQAHGALTNPQTRLTAELSWFPGLGKDDLAKVFGYFNEMKNGRLPEPPGIPSPSGLSALNLRLYALPLRPFENAMRAAYSVLEISRLFGQLNPETVRAEINRDRYVAEFPPVAAGETEEALRGYRIRIRLAVRDMTAVFPRRDLIELAGLLAEKYASDDERYSGAVVIEDVLADYEAQMTPEIKEQKQRIWTLTSTIRVGSDKTQSDEAVRALADSFEQYNTLTLPLQLAAGKRGQRYADFEVIAAAVRDLTEDFKDLRNSFPASLLFTTPPPPPPRPIARQDPAGAADNRRTDEQAESEPLRPNRMDQKYSVCLRADKVTVPPFCTCCMSPTASTETVSFSVRQPDMSTAARTVSLNLPVCGDCLAHRKKAKWANWLPFGLSTLAALASVLLFAWLLPSAQLIFWLLPLLVAAGVYILLGLLLKLPKSGDEHTAVQRSAWISGVNTLDHSILYTFTNRRYAESFSKANIPCDSDSAAETRLIEEPHPNRTQSRTYLRAGSYPVGIGALTLVFTAALLLLLGNNLTAIPAALTVPSASAPSAPLSSQTVTSVPESSAATSSVPESSAVPSEARSSKTASSKASSSKASSAAASSAATSSKPASSVASSTVTSSKPASSVRSSVATSSKTSSVNPSSAASSKTSSASFDEQNEQRREEILLLMADLEKELNDLGRYLYYYEAELDALYATYQKTGNPDDYNQYMALYDEYLAFYEQVYLPVLQEYRALQNEYNSLNPKG